jgi:hypothetical protein
MTIIKTIAIIFSAIAWWGNRSLASNAESTNVILAFSVTANIWLAALVLQIYFMW